MSVGCQPGATPTPEVSKNLRHCVAVLSTSAGLLISNAAIAQDNGNLQVEEVIVTSQKRAESLQDVPIAVSAFSGDDLQERGFVGGGDLEKTVPNLTFQGDTGFGGLNFQIRGIGAQIEGVSADTGVGVHVNSIPITVNRFASSEFYDMERIEVLRGPQGTLYGRNATGGVVNLITAKPESEFSTKLYAEYGSYATGRYGGYINLPVADTLALRVAANITRRDGTISNEATGNDIDNRDIWSTRATLAWQPTDAFSATLMWEHFEQDDNSGYQKNVCATDPGPDSVGGVATNPLSRLFLSNGCLETDVEDPRNNGGGISLMAWPGTWGFVAMVAAPDAFAGQTFSSDLRTVSASRSTRAIADNDFVSLEMEFDFSDQYTLTSLTSSSQDNAFQAAPFQTGVPGIGFADTPFTPGGVFNDPQLGSLSTFYSEAQVTGNTDQFSQELRLSSNYDGPFNFNVGGIYLDLEREQNVTILANTTTLFATLLNLGVIPSPPGTPPVFIDQTSDIASGEGRNYLSIQSEYDLAATALFGEGYYDVSDTVKATLGLRYTRDDKSFVGLAPQLFVPGGTGQLRLPEQNRVFNELSGRFTVDWQMSDNHMLYGSLSRGYKGGGFNPGNVPENQRTFEPEFVNALEIGTKSTIAGGRGTLNLTGFAYDYTNYQIATTTNGVAINQNTDATLLGLEIESTFRVTERLQIDGNIGFISSSIGDVSKLNLYNLTQGDPNLTAVSSISGPTLSTQCVVPTAEVAGVQSAINAGLAPPVALGFLCSGDPTGAGASPNAFPGVEQNLDGNDLPLTPNVTLALGAQYDMNFNSEWAGYFRGDYAYRGSSYAEVFNDLYDRVPDSHNLNLSMTVSSERKGLDLQFYARNLLSQDTIVANRLLTSNPGNYRTVRGKDPAFYGLRVSLRY